VSEPSTGLPGVDATGTGRAIDELLEAAIGVEDTVRFLALADEAQARIAEDLAGSYPRASFARLQALRMVNLVVARHHFHHRHTRLASRPFQLMLDPVNNCHLSCPGCLHTSNPSYSKAFDWPGGALSLEGFDRFLDGHGALASGLVLYNWGEPLLNKKTPEMIRRSKRFLHHVCVSTNLSVRFDVPALVASGVNFLFLSIDGATQEGYSRFRRGGDLELVLKNVRALVEERQRQGSRMPFLLWRFLTFEHNLHEVEPAMELAREIGVDQFSVTTPFAVDWDDPGVRIATSPLEGSHRLNPSAAYKGALDDGLTAELDEVAIEREFERGWAERLPDGPVSEPSRADAPACRWLYQNLTLDARSRLFPCCMAPEFDRHKVYGQLPAEGDGFNVPDMRLSRLAFADRPAFEVAHEAGGGGTPPYCAVCTENPELTYTLERDVRGDLWYHDSKKRLPDELVLRLTEWPASR